MYNNPFLYQRAGLFSRLFGAGALRRINWGSLLSNAQKSLGIINQAIPIVYQVKPIINNAKTMFKIADAMKDTTTSNSSNTTDTTSAMNNNIENDNKPIFYI